MIKNIYLWCKGFCYAERSNEETDSELQKLWNSRVVTGSESITDFLKWRSGYLASKRP